MFEAWLWQYCHYPMQDQAALSPSLGLSEDYQAKLTCSQLQIAAGFTQILYIITHKESPFPRFKASTNWYMCLRCSHPQVGCAAIPASSDRRTGNRHGAFASGLQGTSAAEKGMKSGGKGLFPGPDREWFRLGCAELPTVPSAAAALPSGVAAAPAL